MKRISIISFLHCYYTVVALSGEKSAGDFHVKTEDDGSKLEFEALQMLHIHLDDDRNGGVDFSESQEFLQQELQVQDHKRHSKFHSGDGSVSVNDLWNAWEKSEVSKWSPDEVADWLTNTVHLPQYAEVFKFNQINGHHLPRLASPDDGILLNELKITNLIDRKKIALRAMDVVLFGAPRGHNYLKDLILCFAVLIAMVGFWFSNVQKRKAQKQMESMMKDVECLQDAEKNLTSLQNRLQEAEKSHQVVQQEKFQLESNLKEEIETAKREAQRLREAREDNSEETHTRLKLAEQELVQVREALWKAEKEVASSGMSSSLQKLLQITYQIEVKNFRYRRNVALRKMEEAKDACYRLKRKRNSVLGALRLAHDQNIDEVDQRILAARTSLAEVTSDLEELQYRWQQIEICCRLDLGVCTSLLMSETTDSPLNHARLISDRSTSALGSASSVSRESLAIHRVLTYPSFQSVGESPTLHGLARSTKSAPCVERDTSSCINENGVIHPTSDAHSTGPWDDVDSTFNEHDMVETAARSEQGTDSTGQKNSSSKHGSFSDSKSHSFSEEKSSGHKKKWWVRSRKHHSEEENRGTIKKSRSRVSLPQVLL